MKKPRKSVGKKKSGTNAEEPAFGSDVDEHFVTYSTDVISEVTDVRFYEDTVKKIRMGHREVPVGYPSINAAIVEGLTNPTHIESRKPGHYLFVDSTSTNQSGDAMRMPLKVIEGTSARLQSVYFASTSEDGSNVIWRSSNGKK